MFPKLDGDLSLVAQHFRFDHLTISDANETVASNITNPRIYATKRFKDEEGDESTQRADSQANDASRKDDFIVSKATKILEEVINKAEMPKRRSETSLIESARNACTTHSVQKQMSFHESGSTMSLTAYCHQRSDAGRYPRRNVEYSRFLSVDQRSISDTEDNSGGGVEFSERSDSKTQSCANLVKLSPLPPHSPGAVLVKEKYIELPKRFAHRSLTPSITREKIQFSLSVDRSIAVCPTIASTASGIIKPRFITTKVDESYLSDSNQ